MSIRKPSIFIASSGKSEPLARELVDRLGQKDQFLKIILWTDDARENPGTTISKRLKEGAEQCDYAAVFLTKDDVTLKKQIEQRVPRDNCVFEAGFFTGALGIQFERCFLICDVDTEALPSDIHEIQHIPFKQPPDLQKIQTLLTTDPSALSISEKREVEEFDASMDKIIRTILPKARIPLGRSKLALEILSDEELIEREQIGWNLKKGSVVVNAKQPLEESYPFAMRVMENMRKDVDYMYFFHADPMGTNFIAKMLRMISVAGLSKEKDPKRVPAELEQAELEQIMKTQTAAICDNLEYIQGRLSVNFLPSETPLECCIHNAESKKEAKCYLRYSDSYFVQWYKDDAPGAARIAEDLRNQCLPDQEEIFRSTRDFRLNEPANQQFKNSLHKAIDRYFTQEELRKKVKEVCFGPQSNNGSPAR
jgi:hypothetical protein